MRDQAEQMPSVGVVGVLADDVLVDGRCLFQAARHLQPEGYFHRVFGVSRIRGRRLIAIVVVAD